MVRRLVLGCGSAGERVVGVVSTWGGELHAVVRDDAALEGVDGVDVVRGDPTDPSTYPDAADVVLVLGEDAERNLTAARRAREAFPDALIVACGGWRGTETAAALADVADRVVDVHELVANHLFDSVTGDAAERVRRLLSVLRDIDGRLAVVMHDNPDPDAIASAIALAHVARSIGVDADPCYFGEISHQENRALVNLLDLDLRNVEAADEIDEYAGVALVDHSRPGVNDGLDPNTEVDVVIDHHPPRAPVEARFVDLRSSVGSTSTLIAGYFDQLGIEPPTDIATGLLYGLQTDTDDFSREVSIADFEAAARLIDRADSSALQRIESPSATADTLETIASAIVNRRIEENVLTTGVGTINDRDALAQAADKLLEMDGISTTLVFGYTEETVYVSARSRGTDLDLGEALRDAFGQIGSAGGHAEMAGAQIPVGMLVEETDEADRGEVIEEVITERFFETLGIELNRPATAVYADFLGTDVGE
jgi:nanoRNase/pAp phosphatase (c-di-AMP/oligoRNAs hydrolase)